MNFGDGVQPLNSIDFEEKKLIAFIGRFINRLE